MNTKDIYICKIATCLILPEIFHKVSLPQASFKTFLFTMASFPPDIDKFIDSDVYVKATHLYHLLFSEGQRDWLQLQPLF